MVDRSQLLERARDLVSDSAEAARTGTRRANSFIHRSPLAATAIGIGAGIMIGLIAGRPKEKREIRNPARRARKKAKPGRR